MAQFKRTQQTSTSTVQSSSNTVKTKIASNSAVQLSEKKAKESEPMIIGPGEEEYGVKALVKQQSCENQRPTPMTMMNAKADENSAAESGMIGSH